MIRIGILLDICGIIYTKEQLIKLENLVDSWMKKEITSSKDLLPNFTESREQNFLPCEIKKEQKSFADNDYSAENYVIEKKVFEIKKEINTEYYTEEGNIEDASSFEDNGKNEYLEVPINPNNFFPYIKSGQYQDGWTKENKARQLTIAKSKAAKAAKTSFECKYCEEKYTTFGMLEEHIKEVHSLFQCEECKYSGPTKELLEKHKIRVHKKRQYVCRSCDLSFNNVGKINKHMKLNHGKILDHFCTRCEEVYPTKSQLDKHFHSVHDEKKFQCELCDHISANAQNLKYHVNTVHLKLKPYFCEKCGKSFVQKRRLEEHILNIHNPEGKAFQCDLCGNCYASKTSLTIHRRELHNKVFKCDHCAKFFGHIKRSVICNLA